MKCAILLSGGVDSAVAALLMKQRGFDVEGFFMDIGVESRDAINRVSTVADFLEIKLNIIDVSDEFKKRVIEYFKNEYQNLRTPNPCVACNQWIKFGVLYDEIRKRGFDTICTGHYIIITNYELRITNENSKSKIQNRKKVINYKLQVAKDLKKDQSYFLYNLTQEHLKYLEFPLGELTKDEVREIAEKNNIPVPEGESQDICFLRGDHSKYLKEYLRFETGPIVDKSGKIIGQHQGLPLYTIGQRRLIEIGGTGPYYVLKTDIATNTLYVTDRFDDPDLYSDEFEIEDVNWISGEPPKSTELKVKIRYLHPAVDAGSVEEIEGGRYRVKLVEKQRAITPGQSAVFYSGNELLGGGIIN